MLGDAERIAEQNICLTEQDDLLLMSRNSFRLPILTVRHPLPKQENRFLYVKRLEVGSCLYISCSEASALPSSRVCPIGRRVVV